MRAASSGWISSVQRSTPAHQRRHVVQPGVVGAQVPPTGQHQTLVGPGRAAHAAAGRRRRAVVHQLDWPRRCAHRASSRPPSSSPSRNPSGWARTSSRVRPPGSAPRPSPHGPSRIPRSKRRSGPRPRKACDHLLRVAAGRAACPAAAHAWRPGRWCRGRPWPAGRHRAPVCPAPPPPGAAGSPTRAGRSDAGANTGSDHFRQDDKRVHPVQVVGVRTLQRGQPGEDDVRVPGGLVEPVVDADNASSMRAPRPDGRLPARRRRVAGDRDQRADPARRPG